MGNYPVVHNLKLKACCHKTLKRINQRSELGNILQKSLGAGLWLTIFGPSPSSMDTLYSVSQVDYNTLRTLIEATAAVPQITRRAIRVDCEGEWFDHQLKNEVKLYQFWEGMRNVFL